jgi:SAM-dependent methyltransferase
MQSMPIDDITQRVSERYAKAAATGEQMCCPTTYDMAHLRTFIPDEVLHVSYGCGTPAGLDSVKPGEIVVDIGSGGGIDCFEASRLVGPNGRVIGIDMTDTMLDIARRHAALVATNLGYPASNVEFRKGRADAMPAEDGSADLIISNCVINLAPDKPAVFREMYRVLKAGGRFTVSDIVADQTVPQYLVHDSQKWGDCLSGALALEDYLDGLTGAGFAGVHVVKSSPWRTLDGIQFFSITLTGYKCAAASPSTARFATLCGPFTRVVDERGRLYQRGIPQPVSPDAASLLALPPLAPHFLLTPAPTWLDETDARWSAVFPDVSPCLWQGDFALLAGPFLETADDDGHLYRRGEPQEICSKSRRVLEASGYRSHFVILRRAGQQADAQVTDCASGGDCC